MGVKLIYPFNFGNFQVSRYPKLTAIVIGVIFAMNSQAQTNWGTDGNVADSSSFIGTKNAACFRLKSNNLERMRISANGNIGLGTAIPTERLDVNGNISLTGDLIFKGYINTQDTNLRLLSVNKDGVTSTQSLSFVRDFPYIGDCYQKLYSLDGGFTYVPVTMASWANRVSGSKSILYTGSTCASWVGIGTDNPNTRLEVVGDGHFATSLYVGTLDLNQKSGLYIENKTLAGGQKLFNNLLLVKNSSGNKILQLNDNGLLQTREIVTDTDVWPDYVFEKEYNLKPLYEVKSFINKHGHLPNVPKASEITENGINLGNMAKVTMEKVEELTLYLIQQQELLEKQQKQLEQQQRLIEKQQQQINALLK
jgi:hypothetical protein